MFIKEKKDRKKKIGKKNLNFFLYIKNTFLIILLLLFTCFFFFLKVIYINFSVFFLAV